MNGHTPGHWSAAHDFILREPGDTFAPVAVALRSIAERSPEEVAANARLIAAAPDLYEALVALFGADFQEDTQRYWDKARAALAKAEGLELVTVPSGECAFLRPERPAR